MDQILPGIYSPHPDFAKAISKDPRAIAAFEALAPSHRKEINRYLNNLKSETVRTKNIGIVFDFLTGKKPKGLLAVLRVQKPKKK